MNQNIAEATVAAPIICQFAHQVVFHIYEPVLSTPVITNGTRWPALSAGAGAALTSHGLTETDAPDTATPAAIGERQKNETAHNQWAVQLQHPDNLSTLKVMQCRWQVLERVTEAQSMSSGLKTCPRARPTRHNPRATY